MSVRRVRRVVRRMAVGMAVRAALVTTSSSRRSPPRQNNKEVTINDQAGQLDAGLTDKVDVALTGTTSPLALSDAQALRCMVLKLTGTHPGGAYEVHCPTNKKIYVVWNGTAENVTFKTVAGTGIFGQRRRRF